MYSNYNMTYEYDNIIYIFFNLKYNLYLNILNIINTLFYIIYIYIFKLIPTF